jgi:hypothetical protein
VPVMHALNFFITGCAFVAPAFGIFLWRGLFEDVLPRRRVIEIALGALGLHIRHFAYIPLFHISKFCYILRFLLLSRPFRSDFDNFDSNE